jgi:hypothetical protein
VTLEEKTLLAVKKHRGFQVKHLGATVSILRPRRPSPMAWIYLSYDRSMGFTTHASQSGLLAYPAFNRDIRPQRVDEYADEMSAGCWHDLFSDPITITRNGQIINGQHRLAAASQVDWSRVQNDPAFLVAWGVDPKEALRADGSRRTNKDEKTIAYKVATSN